MLQIATFWDIYIPLDRRKSAGRETAYTPYMYIYTYIHTYKYTCSNLKFFYNIFIEIAMPEKALKYFLFQKI